jgi:hypothetical protein
MRAKMKTDNQRREFEFALETVLKASDQRIKGIKVNWDDTDKKHRARANTVTVTYTNGLKRTINVAYSAWRAIASAVIQQA